MIVFAPNAFRRIDFMSRCVVCLLSASFLSPALHAQTPNPVVTEMKAAYTQVKNNLLKAADKAPEELYAFKPTPEMRSLGELIQHIAEAHIGYCGRVNGVTQSPISDPSRRPISSKRSRRLLTCATPVGPPSLMPTLPK
jgi:hypothetical protein